MDNTEPDKTEPTVTYTTPEVPRGDLDDYRPGKGLDSVADLVQDLKENWLATEVTPITTSTGVKFEVTGPRQHIERLADLYGQTLPSAAAAPEPEPAVATQPAPAPEPEPAAPVTAAQPVSGWPSDKRIAENTWGGAPEKGAVHYHDDGPIGTAIRYMGRRDAQMDVDGEPLANVMGQVATDVVYGRRTAQQAVDDLKALRERLPESSHAHACLGRAIEQMDAPVTPVPAVPEGTPEPLRNLVQALHAVPIVRSEPEKELTPLLGLIEDLAAGRTGPGRAAIDLRNLRNKRHESYGDAGKFEIDRAIDAAVEALRGPRR